MTLTTALTDLGYPVVESHANFVWLPLGPGTAAFADHCADHDIAVRGFRDEGVRVTVGTDQECATFLAAAEHHTVPRVPAG